MSATFARSNTPAPEGLHLYEVWYYDGRPYAEGACVVDVWAESPRDARNFLRPHGIYPSDIAERKAA